MRSSAGPAGATSIWRWYVQSAAGAQRAFDALSGEVHASAQTVMLNDSLYLREALLGRMRQAFFAGGIGPTAALAAGGPTTWRMRRNPARRPPRPLRPSWPMRVSERPAFPLKAAPAGVPATTFWTQGVGSGGRFGGDGNAADANGTLAGFFSGVDRRFGSNWLAGVAGGYTNSSVSVSDRGSSANIDTAHLAGYAAANSGPWNVRGCGGGQLQYARHQSLDRLSRLCRHRERSLWRGHGADLRRGEL